VVVKPVDSSGSDGVRVCRCDQDIEQAVASVLNVVNAEGSMNTMVVVEELLQGVEFVVNTVSLNGHHCITDVWTGPPKCQPDGVGVIFDRQDLAAPNQDLVEYSFAVLDALHLRHGAAHLEIMVTERGPVLIECNARASGDLPRCRASLGRDQLEVLAMSLADPAAFLSLPQEPPPCTMQMAAIFLRSDCDGILPASSLERLSELRTFQAFGRHLRNFRPPTGKPGMRFRDVRVGPTDCLSTCPGVVLLGCADAGVLEEDVQRIRDWEATDLYCALEAAGENGENFQ